MSEHSMARFDTASDSLTKEHWGPGGPWARRTGYRRSTLVAAGGVCLFALGLTGWGVDEVRHSCAGLRSGMTKIQNECIGVSTDGFTFGQEEYSAGLKRIDSQNAAIAGHQAVTVALLNPWSAQPTSALTAKELANQIEGAAAAQNIINTQVGRSGNPGVRIRLVLANQGGLQAHWERVGRRLIEMRDDEAPLVGVVGMGPSTAASLPSARQLSHAQIPMVGVITTADQLNYAAVQGLVKVLPSVREYAAAMTPYLRKHQRELAPAIMVYDKNADDPKTGDLFVKAVREDMERSFGPWIKGSSKAFHGQVGDSDHRTDQFTAAVDVCSSLQPKSVVYAGRKVDLKNLLSDLETRICSDRKLTVIAAGTDLGGILPREEIPRLREKNISLLYSAGANYHAWTANADDAPEGFASFYRTFTTLSFPETHLASSQAMGAHDGVMIIAKALKLALDTDPDSIPPTGRVFDQLINLNGANIVRGAAGDLSFGRRDPGRDPEGLLTGDPKDKPILIMKFPADHEDFPQEVDRQLAGSGRGPATTDRQR
ncbi:MAG TPA: hypothetical protein VLL08_20405 [Kineosporiaceae bacterium]|nr:hypothetical protein [Kineosporiaceae bacterium]